MVVNYPDGSPLTRERIGEQYDLERRIAAIPGVLRTSSIYYIDPKLGRAGRHIVVIQATSAAQPTSDGARSVVRAIRADARVGHGGQVLVGGDTALDMDYVGFITGRTPLAVGFVVLVTYLVLFLLTGSVVLPLKAVVVNLNRRVLRSPGLDLPAGSLQWAAGVQPQIIDPSNSRDPVLHRVRNVNGLRSSARKPNPRGIPEVAPLRPPRSKLDQQQGPRAPHAGGPTPSR